MKQPITVLAATVLASALMVASVAGAADEPRVLKWAELKPKTLPPATRSKKFFCRLNQAST